MKHQHAIRMIQPFGRPFEALAIYETKNHQLTIDDFGAINSINDGYQYLVSFYIGFMSKDEACDKLNSMNIKTLKNWNQYDK